MRKKVIAISMLCVFFVIQYGKVATYLYCKWQAEVVQQLKDCGCESHLAGMLSAKTPMADAPHAVKGTSFENIQDISFGVPASSSSESHLQFADYNSSLISRTTRPAFRPPAA